MKIEFRCNNCGTRYKVKEELAGKKTRCKKCEQPLEVPFPPLELPREVSEGGSTIYRYEERASDLQLAIGDEENIEVISNHIEKHIGEVKMVFHELVSDLVHLDVHWVEATAERPWHTWVTSGMSDRKMKTPEGAEDCGYAELMICLPADWPISEEAFEDENNYWPMYWLKSLARFPHEYETWLFECHTLPNGDPPEQLAPNTKFNGWLLFLPVLAPEEFWELKINEEKTIHFLAIFPLYNAEMNFKLKHGAEALLEKFEQNGVTEVVDIKRKNTCKKGFWPFR